MLVPLVGFSSRRQEFRAWRTVMFKWRKNPHHTKKIWGKTKLHGNQIESKRKVIAHYKCVLDFQQEKSANCTVQCRYWIISGYIGLFGKAHTVTGTKTGNPAHQYQNQCATINNISWSKRCCNSTIPNCNIFYYNSLFDNSCHAIIEISSDRQYHNVNLLLWQNSLSAETKERQNAIFRPSKNRKKRSE